MINAFFTPLCNRYTERNGWGAVEWHSFPFKLIKSIWILFLLMSTSIRRCFKSWHCEENCENQSSTLQFTLSVEMGHRSGGGGGKVVKVKRESHFYTVEAINPEKSRKLPDYGIVRRFLSRFWPRGAKLEAGRLLSRGSGEEEGDQSLLGRQGGELNWMQENIFLDFAIEIGLIATDND